MAGRWLLIVLFAFLSILITSCSDNSTAPEEFYYSGITANPGDGWIASFDPDDWCYPGTIETNEVVILTSEVALYAADTGETGVTTVKVFNYSQKQIGIQLGTEDPLIGFTPTSITLDPQSWGEFEMAYFAHVYETYETVIPLEVTPNCQTLNLPVAGYAGFVDLPAHGIPPLMFQPAYPNPFRDTVTFQFGVDFTSHVRLEVKGPNSELSVTRVLIDEEYGMGWHYYTWVVGDDVPPGIYRAFIQIGDDFECYGDVDLLAE